MSIFSASIDRFSGRRDLLRRWMFGGHRVWGFLPARVSINHPTLGVDFLKLFLKSPYHTQIEWQIRFDSLVCLAGIKDLNFLLFWTLAAGVALASFWSLVKFCAIFCCCCCCIVVVVVVVCSSCCCCWCCCCRLFSFLVLSFCPQCRVFCCLSVRCFAVTNVTFSAIL